MMRHVPTLLGREIGAFFLGPMAYLVILAFQVIAFLNFWELVDSLSQPQREYSILRDPMTAYVSSSPLFWFAVLVAVPLLTMRLIAEERRTGTIETLLTLPVTEAEVAVAKWLAGVIMYLALLAPFALYLPFLYYQGRYEFDLGPLVSLGIGLTTMGMMFVAIGLLFSATTRNQIVAAIWTFVTLFLSVVLTLLLSSYGARVQAGWAEAARFLSVYMQVVSFGRGQLDLRVIAVHASVCVLALFLAVKVLESRRRR
ncbi:ABC-2 family transporter protein [Aquisphaera giovannonii]|uniref:ABC-2 family transporter protein n=1 Tax=Aquisphaera giovannonii TaxID=406548 RepID=A0A5B9VYZ2_9BACT|nr:ABC transporter permease subunit [Aquisphaera giovannonii]QEH32850.1 ABC-2 family transporter protein [Aquisphaera giovannonii]